MGTSTTQLSGLWVEIGRVDFGAALWDFSNIAKWELQDKVLLTVADATWPLPVAPASIRRRSDRGKRGWSAPHLRLVGTFGYHMRSSA